MKTVRDAMKQKLQAEARQDAKHADGRVLIGTIDLTPTWLDILPTLELLLVDGNATGRANARAELQRMATLADLYVTASKEGKI